MINFNDIIDPEIEDIKMKDFPDFCNAFLAAGEIMEAGITRPLTDDEIDLINDHCSGDINNHIHNNQLY